MYEQIFIGKRWNKFLKEICTELKKESVLITGIPYSGLTSFLKYVESSYKSVTNDKKTIIISVKTLSEKINLNDLQKLIKRKINYKLEFPKYLKNLNCEEIFNELITRNNSILITIDRFQHLSNSEKMLLFLNNLRSINPIKIRFFLSCNITCITKPSKYKCASTLISANQYVLPTFNKKEIAMSITKYKKLFNWNVDKKYANKIFKLTGGIIGLVKYVIKYTHLNKDSDLSENIVIKYPILNFKLKEIYQKLLENKLIIKNKFNTQETTILRKIKIFDDNNNLRIPLLKPFLENQTNKRSLNFHKLLTKQEYYLYQLFISKPNQIISLDEISEKLWGKEEYSKYSTWAIYKTLSNLKKKLKKSDLEIKNYKSRGYSLVVE